MSQEPEIQPPATAAAVPHRTRRAIVVLFFVIGAFAVLAIIGQYRADVRITGQQQTISRQQHEISEQDRKEARVRCASIAGIMKIPVPVPVAGNPSREWVYRYVQIQRRRGLQLGCKLPPPRYVRESSHT